MYGMVNNAIRSFVVEQHGPELWAEVCDRAGVDHGEFAATMPYDDAVSLQLVEQSSAVTCMTVDALLRAIGRYWVQFALRSSFGPLIHFGGTRFEEFLGNLDAMHSKIQASLPELAPPSFKVEGAEDGTILVSYRSVRDGLFPFVEGLFVGLSEHFGQPVEILGFERLGEGAAQWVLRVGERNVDGDLVSAA